MRTCYVGAGGGVIGDEERLLPVLVAELLDGHHPPDPAPGQRGELQRPLWDPPLVLHSLQRDVTTICKVRKYS